MLPEDTRVDTYVKEPEAAAHYFFVLWKTVCPFPSRVRHADTIREMHRLQYKSSQTYRWICQE